MNLLGFNVDAASINIGICFAGMALSAVLFIASLASRINEKRETIYMLLITASDFLIFLFDILYYLESQDKFYTTAERVYIALGGVFTLAVIFCTNMYMIYRLKKKSFISNNIVYVLAFIYGVLAIIFCVAMGEGMDWFYTSDIYANLTPTTAFYVFNFCELTMVAFNIALVISCRKELSREEFWVWIIVFALPVSSYLLYRVSEFEVIDLFMTASLIVMYVAIHNKDAIEKKEIEKELVESNAKLLVSQIQPHFLYNSLNTIYYLIGDDPEKAQEAVSTFSDYLRGNVNSLKNNNPVPIEEELNHVRAYLSLETLRFGEKIHVYIQEEASSFLIPPLTVQPLAENAIKYGLASKKEGGNLYIKTYEDNLRYYVEVSDDGVGFVAEKFEDKAGTSTHVGLYNVYSRLRNMTGGKLRVISEPGKGTQCIIIIPKKKKQ